MYNSLELTTVSERKKGHHDLMTIYDFDDKALTT